MVNLHLHAFRGTFAVQRGRLPSKGDVCRSRGTFAVQKGTFAVQRGRLPSKEAFHFARYAFDFPAWNVQIRELLLGFHHPLFILGCLGPVQEPPCGLILAPYGHIFGPPK